MTCNPRSGLFFLMSLLWSSLLFATPFPHGCEVTGFGFLQSDLILNETGAQTLYLIQNHAHEPVFLERVEDAEHFMNPKLEVKLDASNWSSFASDIQYLHFRCLSSSEEKTVVNCAEILDVCQYPRVKFALSNMGNYWISTNKGLDQVIQETTHKGILLRW